MMSVAKTIAMHKSKVVKKRFIYGIYLLEPKVIIKAVHFRHQHLDRLGFIYIYIYTYMCEAMVVSVEHSGLYRVLWV